MGTDAYRFGGQKVCDNKQVRTDKLDDAVWQDVCELLRNPNLLKEEYERRLAASDEPSAHGRSLTMQVEQSRQTVNRLIDAYSDGVISREEFDPRIERARAQLSQRQNALAQSQAAEADREALQDSLQCLESSPLRSQATSTPPTGTPVAKSSAPPSITLKSSPPRSELPTESTSPFFSIAGKVTEFCTFVGGVHSPLIANIYLDAFDQEMKRRSHRIVRYADDILILCRSESAAHHALAVATSYLEGPLRLTVNVEKTHVTHAARGVKFLGVEIGTRWIRIQRKKVAAFKEKVKRITRRSSPVNLVKVIRDLNPVLRGFANYFRMANCRGEFDRLMGWIRRRLRAKQLALWKKPSRLHRRLRQLGYRGDFPKMHMRRWRNSRSPQSSFAMPNGWLTEQGLFDLSTVDTGVLPQVT